MSDERRDHKRVPVLVEVLWEGKTGKYEARTSDLSSGGCFIDTAGLVTQGEEIKFRMQLPNSQWLQLLGEVTYYYPRIGFGVRFKNVSEDAQKKIEWLVKAHAFRLDRQK